MTHTQIKRCRLYTREGNLWQQAGKLGEEGFKLMNSGGGGQTGNANATTHNEGIRQDNLSSDKGAVVASCDGNQQTNRLRGLHSCSGSTCNPPGKPVCSSTFLKCLYTNAPSMGNKQEELEVCVQSQGRDLIAITETWWDSSHDWSVVMDGYRLFRKDRLAR